MPRFERRDFVILIIGLVILSLFGWFVWLRVASPFDGARLPPGTPVWRPEGLLIQPLEEGIGGLRSGDLVVALDGRDLESWAQSLFQPGSTGAKWQFGQTVAYTVMRAGRQIEVKVKLDPYPPGAILGEAWGLLLFGLANLAVDGIIFVKSQMRGVAQVYYLTAVSVLGSTTWAFGLQVSDLTNREIFWLFYVTTTVRFCSIRCGNASRIVLSAAFTGGNTMSAKPWRLSAKPCRTKSIWNDYRPPDSGRPGDHAAGSRFLMDAGRCGNLCRPWPAT